MILNKIDDPRSDLDKAHRRELYDFAKANGIAEITEDTPAILARHILRQRGLTRIKIPPRVLGQTNQPGTGLKYQNHMLAATGQPQNTVETDMIADLAKQFAQQPKPEKPTAQMNINELRNACKAKGIKLSRRDNMETLRAKLNG